MRVRVSMLYLEKVGFSCGDREWGRRGAVRVVLLLYLEKVDFSFGSSQASLMS